MAKRKTAEEIARDILAWIKTPDGQRKLRASAARANATTRKLEKASPRIDPRKLWERYGQAA